MKRRQMLQASAAALLPATLPPAALARAAALPTDPLQALPIAFSDPVETRGPTEVRWQGRLPAELRGTLFRNGPARMQRGATRYQHWFDGDGMVQSFAFGAGGLEHRAAMVRTDKYVAEERAGRFLRTAFGTALPDADPVRRPDDMNVANIALLPLDGELLALWEAGSPWRIEPRTLHTLGRKVWSDDTDGAPFSAHPRVDPDGTVWSFGYLPGSGKLLLYRLDPQGRLVRNGLIDAPNADMVHDFAVTERHLVFLLIPLTVEPGTSRREASFVDRCRWHGDRPAVLLLVDKASLQVTQRVELPSLALFHLGNAWEERGSLRVQFVRVSDFGRLMADISAATVGRPFGPMARSRVHEVRLDLASGRVSLEQVADRLAEFPRFDPRHVGRPTRALFVSSRSATMPAHLFGFNGVARLDLQTGAEQHYHYGDQLIAEEHLLVPRVGGGEGEGWLVGTALDWRHRRTQVAVFDAGRLADGPLAHATLPYLMPPGLHGVWVARSV